MWGQSRVPPFFGNSFRWLQISRGWMIGPRPSLVGRADPIPQPGRLMGPSLIGHPGKHQGRECRPAVLWESWWTGKHGVRSPSAGSYPLTAFPTRWHRPPSTVAMFMSIGRTSRIRDLELWSPSGPTLTRRDWGRRNAGRAPSKDFCFHETPSRPSHFLCPRPIRALRT